MTATTANATMRSGVLVAVCWVLAQAAYGQYARLPTVDSLATARMMTASAKTAAPGASLDLRRMILNEDVATFGAGAANASATPPPVYRALFCRMDDDFDERKIPLRIRAGEIDAINRMERKPGY